MTEDPARRRQVRADRDGEYADARLPERTYLSRSFDLAGAPGVPARFVTKVFDPEAPEDLEPAGEGTEWLIRESAKGRVQLKLLVSREPGHVTHVWIQRISHSNRGATATNVLSLGDQDSARLIQLLKNLEYIPVSGEERTRVDDALVKALFTSPELLTQLYEQDPVLFRRLISDDAAARDVVALARRRAEVGRFRRLLDDPAYFDAEVARTPRKRGEDVWQFFFEANPWILGTGLGGQLFTSWDAGKLEQVVGGPSIASEGKRADALMRTSGVVRWMTFAEFKTHRTDLQAAEYRSGAWPPSAELVAGVSQAQSTVRRAIQEIGEVLRGTAADGSEIPDEMTFLTRPRSFLIIGRLDQLLGDRGGPHIPKIRSFEMFRRNLTEPEIVTFDELLARAEWVVDTEDRG